MKPTPLLMNPCPSRRAPSTRLLALAVGSVLCLAMPSYAAELIVRVSGIGEPLGHIGCSLFSGTAGFPMDNSGARQFWLPADAKGVTCRFGDVAQGSYAVSIGHDVNGNRKVDTNFVGLPTEQWGVSNNVRPMLRAPHFEEAALKVGADAKEAVIDIRVAR